MLDGNYEWGTLRYEYNFIYICFRLYFYVLDCKLRKAKKFKKNFYKFMCVAKFNVEDARLIYKGYPSLLHLKLLWIFIF